MKIYARQVNPADQESPLSYDDGFFPDDIAVFGNRDYNEHLPEVVARVRESLDGDDLPEVLNDIAAGRADFAALLDVLPPENRREYTPEEAHLLQYGYIRYCDSYAPSSRDGFCYVLTAVTGMKWKYKTIIGDSQGEWQGVYYIADNWSREALDGFEAEYFNTGTEWIVEEYTDDEEQPASPADINGWSCYCVAALDDDIRAEIANDAGCSPDDVILYRWKGVRLVDVYEEV